MTVIELNNVTFRRGEKVILDNISWQIQPGQHWALLGANGSGKTTLLKIVTGYSWPSAGAVTLLDQRFGQCDIRQCRKAVGWVSSAIQQQLPARDTAAQIV
ncbi:MAG: ATP-binding cassette domain-containing protein, partial [Sedimentisphaerales bacterium]|nr:ATP-binding cassette domain-containing protein [Sedimentisphaerales bacterium]